MTETIKNAHLLRRGEVGLRVAHLEFYLTHIGLAISPFVVGEMEFVQSLADRLNKVDDLEAQVEYLKNPRHPVPRMVGSAQVDIQKLETVL